MGLKSSSHYIILDLIHCRMMIRISQRQHKGGGVLCAILYLEISDKSRFSDLRKCVEE